MIDCIDVLINKCIEKGKNTVARANFVVLVLTEHLVGTRETILLFTSVFLPSK